MDGQRFDNLARLFGASLSRKRFVALVAGIAAPAALANDAATKKRKKRNRGRGGGDVAPQGENGETCSGVCTKDSDCPFSPDADCICDLETNRCQTVLCGGECLKTSDCQPTAGCTCSFEGVGEGDPGYCTTATCGYYCNKGQCRPSQPEGDSCVCDNESGLCVTIACPGSCADNAECELNGQEDCVCFLGNEVDVASLADVAAAAVGAEGGPIGSCGGCIVAGEACFASTECCGQLVCAGVSDAPSEEGLIAGTCQRKRPPKPNDRCGSHGESCQRDNDCCAQAVCYKGECGEKDTHCRNDAECAAGYRCQGGPLSPGHRRCRKNGRRGRNRRNKNGNKR